MLLPRRLFLPLLIVPAVLSDPTPADDYLERYRALMSVELDPSRVAVVNGLVLRRDAGELTLERGTLYMMTPVDGRTIGAVFEGTGRFRLAPALAVERGQLERLAGKPVLDDTITRAVLLFADSTPAQLASLPRASGGVPSSVASAMRDVLGSLKGENEGMFPASIIAPLLNGESNGLFFAHLTRSRGDPMIFEYTIPTSPSRPRFTGRCGRCTGARTGRSCCSIRNSARVAAPQMNGGSAIA
jgi:hypothetical protein